MRKLLLSGLALCVLLDGDFAASGWRYRRPLSVAGPSEASVAQFAVDAELYKECAANLDDLRILRNQAETPYVILALAGGHEETQSPATMLEKAYVPGAGVRAVLDLKSHREHNRARIQTPLHNYKETVLVETSDDGRVWTAVQTSGPIFDISRYGYAGEETTIAYPTSTRRFVRLTIPGWTEAANLENAWLFDLNETAATRDAVATLAPTVKEDAKAQTTELRFDLGFAGQPVDRIELTADPDYFSRTVAIEATNDLDHWRGVSGGLIFRTAEGEHLTLDIPERTERYFRIVVMDADSAPVHFGRATLSGVRRIVKFSTSDRGGGDYFVYAGNANARRPAYDFARVLPAGARPAEAMLGKAETNPEFRLPERPWTDRNPWLLNGTLVVAVIAMSVVTLRMLKRVNAR